MNTILVITLTGFQLKPISGFGWMGSCEGAGLIYSEDGISRDEIPYPVN